jgi:hypothetical protein
MGKTQQTGKNGHNKKIMGSFSDKPKSPGEEQDTRSFFFSACYTDQVTSMRTLVRWGLII